MNLYKWLLLPLAALSFYTYGQSIAPHEAMTEITQGEEFTDQQRRSLAQLAANCGDWPKVFELIYPLAEKGDANAQANLGILYVQGKGVAQDADKAYWWFSEAAEQGNIKGINYLAFLYLDGLGTQKNIPHGIKLLKKTAQAGNQTAMFILGVLYYRDLQDFKNAFIWFERAANTDHNESKFRLATMYEEGKGIKKNEQKAIYWYRETLKHQDQFAEQAQKRLNALKPHAVNQTNTDDK